MDGRFGLHVEVGVVGIYHIGMTMKEMQASLKIKALEMFWRASMECQLAVLLNRR